MNNSSYHPTHAAWRQRCGLTVEKQTETQVTLRLPPLPHNINLSGTLHGGISASSSLEAAFILAATNNLNLFPVSMRTSYLYGGKAHDSHVVATVMSKTRSYLFVRSDVFDDENNLLTSSDIILRKRSAAAAEQHFLVPPLVRDHNDTANNYAADIREKLLTAQMQLNARQNGFSSGLQLEHVSPGYCTHLQDVVGATREATGSLALGAIVKAADDCGSLCSHLLIDGKVRLSATLSLQLSFHNEPSTSSVRLHGQTMTRQDGVAHNHIIATDTASGNLILTGELCHLLR